MRRRLVLVAMFVAIVVAVVVLGAGAAFAGSNSVTSLGTVETPAGVSMQTYRVTLDVEHGYCAATVTQLPDGTLKTQYYKDMDEFEAADDSSADSESTTTTVKTGVSALSEARADLFSPLAVTSQRVVNALGKAQVRGHHLQQPQHQADLQLQRQPGDLGELVGLIRLDLAVDVLRHRLSGPRLNTRVVRSARTPTRATERPAERSTTTKSATTLGAMGAARTPRGASTRSTADCRVGHTPSVPTSGWGRPRVCLTQAVR